MNMLEKFALFTFGMLIGGLVVWMVDYFVYFHIFKDLLEICGDACLGG